MLHMYEDVINTVILMQVASPQIAQLYKCNYVLFNPSPGMNETMYYLENHRHYLESTAERLKVYYSIQNQSAETHARKGPNPMTSQLG